MMFYGYVSIITIIIITIIIIIITIIYYDLTLQEDFND